MKLHLPKFSPPFLQKGDKNVSFLRLLVCKDF